jgi:hypothetical protein
MQNQLSSRARLGDGSARSSEKPKRMWSVRKGEAPMSPLGSGDRITTMITVRLARNFLAAIQLAAVVAY